MQQEMNGLDFGNYFQVSNQMPTSNVTQRSVYQQQTPRININQQYYHQHSQQQRQQQQPPFEMIDWQNDVAQNYSITPQPDYFHSNSANSGNASTSSISPKMNISQSPPYSNNNLNYRPETDNKANINQFESANANYHHAPIHNNSFPPTPISDVMFPETPQSQRTSVPSVEPNSPNSDSNDQPNLSYAFAAIDKWRLSTDSKDNHYVKNWRKTKYSNDSSMITFDIGSVKSDVSSPLEAGYHLKKVAHNAIERRYRNNINDRIQALKNVVPALYKAKASRDRKKKISKNYQDSCSSDDEEVEGTGEFADGVEIAKKLNKATILHKATEYIHYLKYSNEMAEQENQLLQQILAQMPGGSKVLSRFQTQKQEFKKAEEQRIAAERKEAMEREKIEHQNMLRERASQRAALAELLPKKERRPYRRRNPPKKKNADEHKPFLAIFLCLAMVCPLSFENTAAHPYHESRAISSRILPGEMAFDYWYWVKLSIVIILLVYAFTRCKLVTFKKSKTLHV